MHHTIAPKITKFTPANSTRAAFANIASHVTPTIGASRLKTFHHNHHGTRSVAGDSVTTAIDNPRAASSSSRGPSASALAATLLVSDTQSTVDIPATSP